MSSDFSYGQGGTQFGEYPISSSKNATQSKSKSSFNANPYSSSNFGDAFNTQDFSITDTFQDYSTTGNVGQFDVLSGGDFIDTTAFPGTTTTYETTDYKITDTNFGGFETTYGGSQSTTNLDNYGFDSVDIFGTTNSANNTASQFGEYKRTNTKKNKNSYDNFGTGFYDDAFTTTTTTTTVTDNNTNNFGTYETFDLFDIPGLDTFDTNNYKGVETVVNTTSTLDTNNYTTGNENYDFFSTNYETTQYDSKSPILNTSPDFSGSIVDTINYTTNTPTYDFNEYTTSTKYDNSYKGFDPIIDTTSSIDNLGTTTTVTYETTPTTYDITSDFGTNYDTSNAGLDTALDYLDLFPTENYGSTTTFTEYQTTTSAKKPVSSKPKKYTTSYTTSAPVETTSYTSYDTGLDLGFLDTLSTYDTTNTYTDYQTSTNLNGFDTFSTVDDALYSTPSVPQYTSITEQVTVPSVVKSAKVHTYTPPAPVISSTLNTGSTFREYKATPSKHTSVTTYVQPEPLKPITIKIPKVHKVIIPKIKKVYIPSKTKIIVNKPSSTTSIIIPETSTSYSQNITYVPPPSLPVSQTITTITTLPEPVPKPSISMVPAPIVTSTILKPKRSISTSYVTSKVYKSMPSQSISLVPQPIVSQVPNIKIKHVKVPTTSIIQTNYQTPAANYSTYTPLNKKIIKNIRYPHRAYSAKL